MLSEGACVFVLERESRARERGAKLLAHMIKPETEEAESSTRPAAIVSGASCRPPGGVFIEAWIGRCPGASAAAALAAANGAVGGHRVPIVAGADESQVAVGRAAMDSLPMTDGCLPAIVLAETESGEARSLRLAIPCDVHSS
jgi:hypothetical protein